MGPAFAGFGVIKRSWFTPIVWGLVATVIAGVPVLFILPAMIEMFQVVGASVGTDVAPDQAEITRLSNQINIIQPISWLTQLVVHGLVTGAVFRAVLHPDQKRWFYMRVGMGEVMLVAASLVMYIIATVASIIPFLVGFVVGLILWWVSHAAAIIVGILVALIGLGVVIWGCLRFSIGLPMSHDRKEFLLFEAWKKTAGNAGALLGMGLVSFIIGWLIAMVIIGAMFGLGAFLLFSNGGFEALQALDDSKDFAAFFTPERTQTLLIFGSLYLIVATVVQGYVLTIVGAPWADAYRQLGLPKEEVF
jgi:hypothetical protein